MLILKLKKGSKLKIGDNVTVTVVRVRGGFVKLGFDAPREVAVLRDDAKKREAA